MESLGVKKSTSKSFNPSMRSQLKKIIDKIEITWSYHLAHRRFKRGRMAKCWSLHIILYLKNSKWKDTHLYFSDLEYKMKDLKNIEYEFKKMKEFFDEVDL